MSTFLPDSSTPGPAGSSAKVRNRSSHRRKGLFICLVGMDGSGKTTQARSLVRALEQRGLRTRYVWTKFNPLLSRLFIKAGKFLFLRRRDIFHDYGEYSRSRKKVFTNPLIARGFRFFIYLEYFFEVMYKIRIPLWLRRNIVCDRYVFDTMADMAVDFRYTPERIQEGLELFFRVMPRPQLIFLIDVPPEIAFSRKDDVPSADFLVERRGIFLDMGRHYNMITLDGSRDRDELHALVASKVDEVLNG